MLAVNVNYVHADTAAVQNQSLPPVVESYFEYQAAQAHLNSTQITQMRALWIQRLASNQEIIDSNYGGVAKKEIVKANFNDYPGYMLEYSHYEGTVYNTLSAFGQPDGNFAELYTPIC